METPRKRQFFPWLFRWKFWRVLLLILAGFLTLVALYHAEESWRGKRAWEDYKRAREAQGESFDYATYVPPRAPDDQNFAMTPFLAPIFDYIPGTQKQRDTNAANRALSVGAFRPSADNNNTPTWTDNKPVDLVKLANSWNTNVGAVKFSPTQRREAALEILEKLKPAAPILAELQTASLRPYSRFNIDYDLELKAGILLQHLAVIKQLCGLLRLRACAELELGQTDAAFQDVGLMFHLMNSMRNEPFLISQLVRAADLTQILQPIWEGLSHHQWSDKQLAGFTGELRALDFLDDDVRVLRGESHLWDSYFAHLRTSRNPIRDMDSLGDSRSSGAADLLGDAICLLVPRGWFYFEQVNYYRLFNEEANEVMTPRGIDPNVAERKDAEVRREVSSMGSSFLRHTLLSRALLPTLSGFELKMARAQTYVNLAEIACSLERYRVTHGQFPETLDNLAPQFLPAVPHDVIMDQPLKYRRTDDGRFILYSVGWNKKDDNGVVAKESQEKTKGDWAWKYPR